MSFTLRGEFQPHEFGGHKRSGNAAIKLLHIAPQHRYNPAGARVKLDVLAVIRMPGAHLQRTRMNDRRHLGAIVQLF